MFYVDSSFSAWIPLFDHLDYAMTSSGVGIPEDRDGLFDTIQRSKSHYQKRAYQCIKMLVALFTHCTPATSMLHTNGDLKRKWTHAVEWLHDELDRRPYPGNAQYTYNNWSPPAQSNETSNGYFLERSQSARITLTKAIALCPEEEPEEGDLTDDPENPPADDQSPGPTPQGQSPSPSPGQPAPQTGQQPGQAPQQSQQQAHTSSQQTPPQSTSPVQQGQGKQMAEKDQQTQQVPVQNNQVKVNGQLPVQPNNQINNELNQIEIPQTTTEPESTSESTQGNPDTGEEERQKETDEINNTNNNHPGKSSPNTTK